MSDLTPSPNGVYNILRLKRVKYFYHKKYLTENSINIHHLKNIKQKSIDKKRSHITVITSSTFFRLIWTLHLPCNVPKLIFSLSHNSHTRHVFHLISLSQFRSKGMRHHHIMPSCLKPLYVRTWHLLLVLGLLPAP